MHRLIPIFVFALVISACASAATDSAPDAGVVATTQPSESVATSDAGSDTSSAPTTTVDDAPATTSAPDAAVTTDFDGVAAPDFRMALADGSEFVLSEESKPVYMIFWAEW